MEPINAKWKLIWGLLLLIFFFPIFQEMTFANYFVNISQTTLNFLVRLIFLKTRHLGGGGGGSIWAQLWGNSNKKWVIFFFPKLALRVVVECYWKNQTFNCFVCSPLPPTPKINAIAFPNSEIGPRFMISSHPLLTLIRCHPSP